MKRLGCSILAIAGLAGAALAKDDPYCAVLSSALAAARAGNGFADITGADAGFYNETSLVLPGAKLCATSPREWPAAAWRCHLETNERYTLALDVHAAFLRRLEACLGPEWSGERLTDQGYLRVDRYTRAGDGARVQVLTTTAPKYRLFVAVLSRQPAPAAIPR